MPSPGGPRQRRLAIVISRVGIDLARVKQQLGDSLVPFSGGPRQRRQAIGIPGVSIDSLRRYIKEMDVMRSLDDHCQLRGPYH